MDDSEGLMLNEISQTEKIYILYALIYMWNLKNKQKKKNQAHGYREQIGGCLREVGVGG